MSRRKSRKGSKTAMSKFQKFSKSKIVTWFCIILLLVLIDIIIWQVVSYNPNANDIVLASIGLPLIGAGYLVREIASRLAGDSTIDAPLPSKKKKGKLKNYLANLTEEEMQLIIRHRRQK
jgi:hypothetical protein